MWNHNHAIALKATPSSSPTAVAITSPEGYLRTFVKAVGSSVWTATNGADVLTESGGAWIYRRSDDDAVLAFTSDGKLQTRTERGGFVYAYTYDGSGRLASVSNGFGRSLVFAYAGGKLATVTTPDGRVIGYTYDASGRLATVLYPDGKSRGFLYENASFPQALTGILDESGVRWGTFAYDSTGRAISTELAGGVNKYQVSYPSSSSATVIDPLNTSRNYSYATNKGKLAVTGGSLPSGEGESDASSRVQDANGLITSETDFKGVTTTTAWDVSRRLPTSITEASGTPDARTTTYQWHASMALPTLVTEAGRSTAYAYDAQGRVLTKSITDTLVTPNTTKTWTWTYSAQGLVATEQAPNGAVTSYTHDTKGNVLTATNALGHVTGYAYDSANRVVSQTEPNGLVTTYTWDARDRLLTQTVGSGLSGAQTTTLTYNPTGTLSTLTLPTGLSLSYTYDNAHRLTGWSNNRGESGTYTLDAMGNRVSQQIKNSGGALAWSSATTINNLNRVSGRSEGGTQSRTYGYDANGERVSTTNALSQSTQYGLDNLRRTQSITNAANASASLSYNALDGVTGASDFKGVATAYGRDAQGNATVESSADSGSRVASYDTLGLPQQIVDALGQATSITRDTIGRPTQFSYADGKSATLTWDATGAGKGYLRQITDPSGTTTYTRDAFGRVTDKTIVFANGLTASVGYVYDAQGRLTAVLYPAGPAGNFPLVYAYDATGRITGMTWRGWQLLSNITWNALGQPTGWTWAFSGFSGGSNQSTTRSYDTAGRLTQVTVAGTPVLAMSYDAAGRIANYSQQVARPVTPSDPNSAVTSELITWNVGYDNVGRLTSLATATGTPSAAATSSSFGYDANGNRTSSSLTQGTTTTSRIYSLVANTNRPSGFTQTVGSTTTSVTYGYNANGDLTGDGLKGYRYDATGRMVSVAQGSTDTSAVTRYAHNALGQRIFKTEPLYPVQGTTGSALNAFFAKGWTPSTVSAEQVGWAYGYDEEGTLLGEYGMGGAQSAGNKVYVYLPTPSGPMPVIVMDDSSTWAVTVDHLNTPRRVTRVDGNLEWQWSLSGFGQDEPTIAAKKFLPNAATTTSDFSFNLRFPGQTQDRESGLAYNYFRTYDPRTGAYTQMDPKGLAAGFNRRIYVDANPLNFVDPEGLLKVCVFPGGCVDTTPPLIHPDYPYTPTSTNIPVPEWWPYTLPGMVDSACTTASDLIMQMAKGGRQRVKDTGLIGVSDEEIKRRLKDPGTSAEERKRLEKEEKGRGLRNRRKDGRN